MQNYASNTTREDKFLSVFTVVKFPNDACGSSSGLNGTCYTSSQCESLGGSSSGSCASSFGVCCVFSLSCGGSSSQNNTYATMTSYTVSSDPDPCTYTICKSNSDVCKLRIDYESMVIAGPGTVDLTATATVDLSASTIIGDCITDSLTITNPGGSSPPTICGKNTGQHMFVPASDRCNQLKFDIDTGSSDTRTWQIKVTQFECSSPMAPEQDCLQWHTAETGKFYTFNWDTSVATTTAQRHLSDQYYEICFRRKSNFCQICFSPTVHEAIIIDATTFGLGSSSDDPAAKSTGTDAAGKCVGVTTLSITEDAQTGPHTGDYVTLFGANNHPTTCADIGVATKICGVFFTVSDATIVHNTICSCVTPFKMGVHFDTDEAYSHTLTANKKTKSENTTPTLGSGFGLSGFYLDYWQVAC